MRGGVTQQRVLSLAEPIPIMIPARLPHHCGHNSPKSSPQLPVCSLPFQRRRVSTMDFDGVLTTYLGEMGRYQAVLVSILSLLSFPSAFNNLDIIFSAAEPEFWCAASPELQQLNISHDLRQNLTSPWVMKDGTLVRDACKVYVVDWDGVEDGSTPSLPTDASIAPCTAWEYDRTVFTSTVVTQVTSHRVLSEWGISLWRPLLGYP